MTFEKDMPTKVWCLSRVVKLANDDNEKTKRYADEGKPHEVVARLRECE